MRNNQKGFVPIIIILVVLIGLVGVYFLGRLNPKTIVTNPSSSPITTIVPTIKPTTDQTANWKTYNTKKFDFKLPGSIALESESPKSLFFRFKSEQYQITVDIGGQGFGIECIEKTNTETLTVDGRKIIKTTYKSISKPNGMCEGSTDTNREYHYWLRLNPDENENIQDTFVFSFLIKNVSINEANKLFDQILSTFKFANQ